MEKDNLDGRVCKKCQKFKSWTHYFKKKNGINGYDSSCKDCITSTKKRKRREVKKLKNKKIVIDGSSFEIKSIVDGAIDDRVIGDISNLIFRVLH